jgi:hypothetical protein
MLHIRHIFLFISDAVNGFIKANFSGVGVLDPKRNPQLRYQGLHFV